ncbi:putative calcium/proton exchanger [Helianthus annuus]|nr:putative calcium/proton exchanger [Helianthus annuus]
MTAFIALLSEYLVDTIEAASTSWGMPLSFISIILLPIVGNGAKHVGAIIFSLKNMLDITLGVALDSATQNCRCYLINGKKIVKLRWLI